MISPLSVALQGFLFDPATVSVQGFRAPISGPGVNIALGTIFYRPIYRPRRRP